MAYDPRDQAKKARQAYNDVSSVPLLNLQDIVKNSRQLLGAKALANSKKGLKLSKQAEKLAKEQAVLDAKRLAVEETNLKKHQQEIAEQQKAIEDDKKAAAEKIRIEKVKNKLLTAKKLKALRDAKKVKTDEKDVKALDLINKTEGKEQTQHPLMVKARDALFSAEKKIEKAELLNLISPKVLRDIQADYQVAESGINLFDVKLKLQQQEYKKRLEAISHWLKQKAKVVVSNKFGKSKEESFGSRAYKFLGGKASTANEWWKDAKSKVSSGITSGVTALKSGYENSPRAVAAVAKAEQVARFFGNMGQDTFRWLTKKVSSISGMLMNYIRKPFAAVGNAGFGELFGIAALIPTLIGPILSGLNDFLDKTFGEKWFSTLMKTMWEKSWSFIKDTVAGWLGLNTEDQRKAKEEQSNVDTATADLRGAKASFSRPYEDIKVAADKRDASIDVIQKRVDANPSAALAAGIDSVPAKSKLGSRSPQSEKLDILTSRYDSGNPLNWFTANSTLDDQVQDLLKTAPPGSIDPRSADRFNALGRAIKVSPYYVAGAVSWTSPKFAGSTGRGAISAPNPAPYNATGSVMTEKSKETPSAGPGPASVGRPGNGSVGTGASNRLVPNRATPDQLIILNAGVLSN